MTTFVSEVLRRSRTTCSVLQSALCYIEAVRTKVPELVEKERRGEGVRGEQELAERVVQADEAEITAMLCLEGELSSNYSSAAMNSSASEESTALFKDLHAELGSLGLASGQPTVLQNDVLMQMSDLCPTSAASMSAAAASASSTASSQQTSSQETSTRKRKIPPKPLTPLPPLPSPLLCPRRTFLAALILASKFLQDRCYSNRAWAKLSGLPPREVGRCERALGEALEWRLWVGKDTPTLGSEEQRSGGLARSRSDSLVRFSGSSPVSSNCNGMFATAGISPVRALNTSFLSPPLSDAGQSPEIQLQRQTQMQRVPCRGAQRALRRTATLPTLPDETSMRSIPPRYRQNGSLPFAFASTVPPPRPVVANQMSAFTSQPILSSSASAISASSSSFFGLSSTSMVPTPVPSLGSLEKEEQTPRLIVDSPLNVFSNVGNPTLMWSPTSTASNGSSDSGSSLGSIATPPDCTTLNPGFNGGRASSMNANGMVSMGDVLSLLNSVNASKDAAMWYEQVVQALGTNGEAAQSNTQLSMLDNASFLGGSGGI